MKKVLIAASAELGMESKLSTSSSFEALSIYCVELTTHILQGNSKDPPTNPGKLKLLRVLKKQKLWERREERESLRDQLSCLYLYTIMKGISPNAHNPLQVTLALKPVSVAQWLKNGNIQFIQDSEYRCQLPTEKVKNLYQCVDIYRTHQYSLLANRLQCAKQKMELPK